MMRYFSTNRKSAHVSFREAVRNGQPSDKGLYFPETIPQIAPEFWHDFAEKSKAQIAFEVIKPYIGGEIDDENLFKICAETVDFEFPLVQIADNIFVLELFHGATLAFKDVGARFMSRCLTYFSREKQEKTLVLVATSGDTGGAVAAAFYGAENTEVVILYPKGKVSEVQELQLTTLGGNVTAIEVSGSFDDCQALAKTALADENLKQKIFLTSANSINAARWLPQQFYYFFAFQAWKIENQNAEVESPIFCVPSGNFGNICAGILAHKTGLPVKKFIAACNANDVVPRFLQSGEYQVKPSVQTLSNAMDVGNPSNFVRISELFGQDFDKLKETLEAVSISDAETAETMCEVYQKYNYVLDPHGATGFRALQDYLLANKGEAGIFLETAHPIKFDSVKKIIGTFGNTPAAVKDLFAKPKQSLEMKVDYENLTEILRSKF